jgi:hypothetical protein
MRGDNSFLVHIATLYTVSTTVGPSIAYEWEKNPRSLALQIRYLHGQWPQTNTIHWLAYNKPGQCAADILKLNANYNRGSCP